MAVLEKKEEILFRDLTRAGKNAFKGIAKKATITIKASKTNYKKTVKAIKKSGIAKTVKFKRAK